MSYVVLYIVLSSPLLKTHRSTPPSSPHSSLKPPIVAPLPPAIFGRTAYTDKLPLMSRCLCTRHFQRGPSVSRHHPFSFTPANTGHRRRTTVCLCPCGHLPTLPPGPRQPIFAGIEDLLVPTTTGFGPEHQLIGAFRDMVGGRRRSRR